MTRTKKFKGFTLIELLIVIAIIAILAAVAFVALDPLTRFRDARDASRWSDVSAILSAIKVNQVDNGGSYIDEITNMTDGDFYMITADGTSTGCDAQNTICDVDVSSPTSCVDLSDLVSSGHLGEVPVSANGEGTWTDSITGYVLSKSASGIVSVQACESENVDTIKVTR
jgi:prepilin-type N-terminal cleavage/methylation domain-containing protein